MKSITTTLLAIFATTLTLKGVVGAALPEPQTVTFSDGDSIHFTGKRGETAPVLARIAAPDFVKRHPKNIGIVAKAEDIEDCAPPCDFYIRSEESADISIHPLPVGPSKGPTWPGKRDAELVKNSKDVEDCAAPCDFYIRSVDEEEAADDDLATLLLAKKSDEVAGEEECAAPCRFYIRSVDEEEAADDDLATLWLAKKSDEVADDDLSVPWLEKKSENVADEEECAAPCDFYIL